MKFQKNQGRNTKLKKKKKTNNAYLMSQNPHQILENNRLERERERWYRKKPIQSNKEQIKKKRKKRKKTNVMISNR